MKKILFVACISFVMFSSVVSEAIKIVYFNDFAPYSWDEKGEVKGLYKDITEELFLKRLSIPTDHKAYPWERAQRMVMDGSADVFVTVVTDTRKEYATPSDRAVFVLNVVVVTYKGHPDFHKMKTFTKISQFAPYIVSDYIGNGWSKNALKDLSIREFPDVASCLRVIADKKADVHFTSTQIVRYYAIKNAYPLQLVTLPTIYDSLNMHVFIGKKSKYYTRMSEMNVAIERMFKDGTMKKILARY